MNEKGARDVASKNWWIQKDTNLGDSVLVLQERRDERTDKRGFHQPSEKHKSKASQMWSCEPPNNKITRR